MSLGSVSGLLDVADPVGARRATSNRAEDAIQLAASTVPHYQALRQSLVVSSCRWFVEKPLISFAVSQCRADAR